MQLSHTGTHQCMQSVGGQHTLTTPRYTNGYGGDCKRRVGKPGEGFFSRDPVHHGIYLTSNPLWGQGISVKSEHLRKIGQAVFAARWGYEWLGK